MRIWVDADACPGVVKDILYRAAERLQITLTLVANQPLQVPRSRFISTQRVAGGIDVADNAIVQQVLAGDLVVTADIPLAAEVVAKGAHALNPRGELYTTENIKERLALRNFMGELRNQGVASGGPAPLSLADRRAFASRLDALLARHANT